MYADKNTTYAWLKKRPRTTARSQGVRDVVRCGLRDGLGLRPGETGVEVTECANHGKNQVVSEPFARLATIVAVVDTEEGPVSRGC